MCLLSPVTGLGRDSDNEESRTKPGLFPTPKDDGRDVDGRGWVDPPDEPVPSPHQDRRGPLTHTLRPRVSDSLRVGDGRVVCLVYTNVPTSRTPWSSNLAPPTFNVLVIDPDLPPNVADTVGTSGSHRDPEDDQTRPQSPTSSRFLRITPESLGPTQGSLRSLVYPSTLPSHKGTTRLGRKSTVPSVLSRVPEAGVSRCVSPSTYLCHCPGPAVDEGRD